MDDIALPDKAVKTVNMELSLKRWLNTLGGLLCLAGVVFVVTRLSTYAQQIDLSSFTVLDLSSILALSIIYGFANLLLTLAWWYLLGFMNVKVEFKWAIMAYGLSQIAKYVPGNIFHLAGRQAIGMTAGLPAWALAKSVFFELALITVAGSFFVSLTMPLMWENIPEWISIGVFLSISITALGGLYRFKSSSIGAALISQITFLAGSGAVFFSILKIVAPAIDPMPTFSVICGAYVIAWLAGLIAPGAPAGVGVRELVLLFLLGKQIPQVDLLMAVLFSRGVTVLGDLFYFGGAMADKFYRSKSCQ